MPDLGAIHATADLAWAGDWIMLRSAEAAAESLARMQLSAEGRIGKLSGKDFAFELDPQIDLSAASNHSRPLVYLFEGLAKEAGPATDLSPNPSVPPAQRRATGTRDDLVLLIQRGLKSAGSDPGGLDGNMGPRTRAAIEDYQARQGLAVDGRATEDLLRHLQGLTDVARGQRSPEPETTPSRVSGLAESLPELGPVTAAVRLSREDGAYRFDDLNLAFGAKDALRVDVTGTLGALRPEGDVALEEIALAVSFAVPSSRTFSQMLPPEVPEFRKVRGRFDVQGTTQALSISEARITAEGPDGLVATVAGQVAKLSPATGFVTEDLALDLDARWPNTKSVYRLVDLDLPDLGPVWARATLRDRGETFTLTGINVTAGSPDRPAARVTGDIGDLPALRRVKLTGEFEAATATLLDTETVTRDARLGKVHGRFDLSDTDGSLGLEALSAEIEDTKLLSLSITGLFDDIEKGDDIRMEAALTVPDVSQLGREFGFEAEHLGSLSFRGEVSGSDERFRAEGEARLGKTDVTGTLSGSLVGERPALQAKLYSPLFRLADVGLVPQAAAPAPSPDPAAKDKPQEKILANGMVFGEAPIPFEALKDFDLDFDVLFEDLEGVYLDMDTVEGRLDVVDGVLQVDPLSFIFVGGRVDLTLLADARGESPELQLGLVADGVDLGDFLSQSEVDVPLDGELDLIVDLKAAGQSPRALASSLEGEFDLAIKRGRVRTGLLRLTTIDPVSWLFTESARKGYSDMNCLILRFDLQDGVAESQTLLLDTPNILALGKGRVDLRNESIDIEVSPEAKRKRLIAMSTPFAIKGPLANPSVKVSGAGASARTAGEVLVSPVNLLGSLLPFVSDRGKDDDNPCLALQDGVWRQ
jgi:peptidoglycan hydrolase-like protein with peptidoglycan-binding domain